MAAVASHAVTWRTGDGAERTVHRSRLVDRFRLGQRTDLAVAVSTGIPLALVARARRAWGIPPHSTRAGRPALGEADKILSRAELVRLLAAAARLGALHHDAIRLLVGTGLRTFEAADLTVADCRLDADPPHVRVIAGKRRRAGTADSVLVSPAVVAELRTMVDRCAPGAPVLCDSAGLALTRERVSRLVREARDAARIRRPISAHTLRHRFLTDCAIASAGDGAYVARQARHLSLRETVRYLHLADSELRAPARLAAFDRVQAGLDTAGASVTLRHDA